MRKLFTVPFDIQYFAEGAEGGTAGTGGEGGAEGAAPAEAAQPEQAAAKYRGVRRHGAAPADAPQAPASQEPAAEAAPAANEQEAGQAEADPDAEFESLIKGRYKDQWQKRADAVVNRRFAETKALAQMNKALQESQNALGPVLATLYARHGIDPDAEDARQKLQKAIENDEAYLAHEAGRRGMGLEEFKRQEAMERAHAQSQRELQQFRSAEHQRKLETQRQQRLAQDMQRWRAEESELKKAFPGFNLDQEYQNPDFQFYLHAGRPVEQVYKLLHQDDILGEAMQYTAQKTREQMAKDIAARGSRPPENGASGQAAQIPPFDPDRLTDADIADMRRRARNGEKVDPATYMRR